MFWSDIEADGREGSKNPWECCRLCPFTSPPERRAVCSEACRVKLGLEKLFTDVVLLLAVELGYIEGRVYCGGRGEL